MTLEQLRIFLEVARREHVTQAAQALNLTQSAVSAAISKLENQHNVLLFNRVGRRIELTDVGRQFFAEAHRVLRQAEYAGQFLADFNSSPTGRLRIVASQTVASYWLPPHLVRYHETYPRVRIELQSGNTATAAKAVMDGTADIAVVEGGTAGAVLSRTVVAHDRLIIVVSKTHPWADQRLLRIADLQRSGWIIREAGSGTRAAFEADIGTLGLSASCLPNVLEMPSNEACLAAVAASHSATVLSQRAASPHLAQGEVCKANFELPIRCFAVLTHPQRDHPKSVHAMCSLLSRNGGDIRPV